MLVRQSRLRRADCFKKRLRQTNPILTKKSLLCDMSNFINRSFLCAEYTRYDDDDETSSITIVGTNFKVSFYSADLFTVHLLNR